MNKTIVRTDPYGFGLIVPAKTGIVFEHQCDGYLCSQIQQEGVFIPLSKRYFKSEVDELGNEAFYYEDKDLPFEFEEITFNEITDVSKQIKALIMHEAYEWIIFKGWKDKSNYEAKQFDNLIGKKMLLIYPNSD